MNERIKQLALRANIQYVVKISDDNKDIMCVECDNGFPTAKQFEKFAELIVAECIEVFGRDLPEPGDGKMLEVINRICNVAEHFGVEE